MMNKKHEFEVLDTQSVDGYSPEQLREYIQHAYNLGYAKGLTDNLAQWQKALSDQFNSVANVLVGFYRESIISNITTVDVYYKVDPQAREIAILLVLPENEYENNFYMIYNSNVYCQKVLGESAKCVIDIKCMPDCNVDLESIRFDYPNKL